MVGLAFSEEQFVFHAACHADGIHQPALALAHQFLFSDMPFLHVQAPTIIPFHDYHVAPMVLGKCTYHWYT